MLRSRIKSMLHSLTENELKIVNYINTADIDTRTLTSTTLARQLGVSQSTIIRFTQKLGFTSFRAFLSSLNTHMISLREIYHGIVIDEPTNNTNERMLNQYNDVLRITYEHTNSKDFEKAVELLLSSRRIVLFGIANSGLVAHYLANQLNRYGIHASYDMDNHSSYVNISNLSSEDVLILVSESGETNEVIKAAMAASLVQAKVIAVTGIIKNSLYQYADVVLPTIVFEVDTRVNLLAVFASQLFIADLLLVNLAKADFENLVKRIQKSEKMLKSII